MNRTYPKIHPTSRKPQSLRAFRVLLLRPNSYYTQLLGLAMHELCGGKGVVFSGIIIKRVKRRNAEDMKDRKRLSWEQGQPC